VDPPSEVESGMFFFFFLEVIFYVYGTKTASLQSKTVPSVSRTSTLHSRMALLKSMAEMYSGLAAHGASASGKKPIAKEVYVAGIARIVP